MTLSLEVNVPLFVAGGAKGEGTIYCKDAALFGFR
jgi:hypothetical protein